MKRSSLRSTGALAAIAVTMSLGFAACSDDDGGDTASDTASSSSPSEEMSPSDDMSSDDMSPSDDMTDTEMAMGSEVFGAACSAVPTEGKGSLDAMATEPVANAAASNPLLSTLTAAVTEADLVDALNSAEDITVFAPTNEAFAAIPKKDLNAVLANKKLLTKILTHHVVTEEVEPDELNGTFETLNGDKLKVTGSGEEFSVGDEKAAVLCGNIDTANAKVYLIDTVLMP
ncbi:fasciclin domain-containing protein [Nocardioides sp. zg-DK7169]|uniref:fasciclin domain-containing protein n=1 Tax=Nocardioides sp. zg-DK7169 TaxID=2736600 RepID=UPI001552D201|nr:fasciclin domain-containing protein [Nocardioides sp. zg-DK7169]NPC97146.1 fasciclin domain-containing protein [Nocardioides sp. zg-DK7169]